VNITKEQADKVIAALKDASRSCAEPIEFGALVEAISIMRGLADAEPQNRCITELLAFAKEHPGTYLFPGWDGNRVLKYLATSPQAAQTEATTWTLRY